MTKFYAHSLEAQPVEKWQLLEDHLKNVSETAKYFADYFGGKEWARILGYNHDLGKGTCQWQAFLRHANNVIDEFSAFYEGHPTHAFGGAQWLNRHSKDSGKLLAYCIAGHHGGLSNWSDTADSALERRLEQQLDEIVFPHFVPPFPEQLPFSIDLDERLGFQLQFFTRMLFSCLVDADYLDTEASMNQKKTKWRAQYTDIQELHDIFQSNFNQLRKAADQTSRVNKQREIVLENCLHAAEQAHGLFSLTVPTGGGKTLASLAFALKYAKRHSKRRIIYVIPFTSIIEQNAKVFREMLGDDVVLESTRTKSSQNPPHF